MDSAPAPFDALAPRVEELPGKPHWLVALEVVGEIWRPVYIVSSRTARLATATALRAFYGTSCGPGQRPRPYTVRVLSCKRDDS